MDKKDSIVASLTTEKIKQRFKSQFDLVSYAIRLAENMIRSGREPRIKTDIQNKALQVLSEIAAGKDQFDEILPEQNLNSVPHREHREHRDHHHRDSHDSFQTKSSEKRKPRKIFND